MSTTPIRILLSGLLVGAISLIAGPASGADTSQEKICEAFRQNYDREQKKIDRNKNEPYKANAQRQLDEKRARLEESCRPAETFAAEDETPEAPATDPSVAEPDAPPLFGEASTTTLEGGIDTTDSAPPPTLKPLTPILDPRGKGVGDESPPPASDPGGSRPGHASDSSFSTTTLSGKILGSGGDTTRAVDQTAKEIQPKPAPGGTVNNTFTRSYFFAQGFLNGVMDGASEASGSTARAQVGLYYMLTGRARQAADIMGFKERDTAIKEMQKDIEGWKTATTTSNDPFAAYENGRFEGRQLGKFFVGKYAGEASSLPPSVEQP